jgi:hypothetical protein
VHKLQTAHTQEGSRHAATISSLSISGGGVRPCSVMQSMQGRCWRSQAFGSNSLPQSAHQTPNTNPPTGFVDPGLRTSTAGATGGNMPPQLLPAFQTHEKAPCGFHSRLHNVTQELTSTGGATLRDSLPHDAGVASLVHPAQHTAVGAGEVSRDDVVLRSHRTMAQQQQAEAAGNTGGRKIQA